MEQDDRLIPGQAADRGEGMGTMSLAEWRDACLHNQQMSRDVLRFFAFKLWPQTASELSGHYEAAFWKEVERRWREWLGIGLPFDDEGWRTLAHRLELSPPVTIDEHWLKSNLLPALRAKQLGAIEAPAVAAEQGEGTERLAKRRRKPGRPAVTDPKRDKRIYDGWQSSGRKDLAAYARSRGMKEEDVRKAIERHRKRIERGQV